MSIAGFASTIDEAWWVYLAVVVVWGALIHERWRGCRPALVAVRVHRRN